MAGAAVYMRSPNVLRSSGHACERKSYASTPDHLHQRRLRWCTVCHPHSRRYELQVLCTSMPDGRVYRFYRSTGDFSKNLKPLVPFLLASHADVVVGNEEGDPHLLLRVGPIAGEHEAALIDLLGPNLRCNCGPLPA